MKAAEDQVVEDDASFQDDEVKYDCLQNIFRVFTFTRVFIFLHTWTGVIFPRHRPPAETRDCEWASGRHRWINEAVLTPPLWPQNMADIKKLKLVGICTVKGIQMTTRKALCNIKGLSEAKVEKIKEAAGKVLVNTRPEWNLVFHTQNEEVFMTDFALQNVGFQTAFEYSSKRKQVFHISTGSQEFELRWHHLFL